MWSFKQNIYKSSREDSTCEDCITHNVIIGDQTWAGCNATTEFYKNGNPIPQVTDPNDWANLTTGAWCYYNNDPSTEATYGKLYNWYAVNDVRGFAPIDYHVPTAYEADQLFTHLGGASFAGAKMKETGFCHWNAPNFMATNTSNFTGLPGGYRSITGVFADTGIEGHWWTITSDPEPTTSAVRYDLHYNEEPVNFDSTEKKKGYSVRLIKDTCSTCIEEDVLIGTQIWTRCNANISSYSDGTLIPEETDPAAWVNLQTGAWCYYDNDIANAEYGKLYNWYAAMGIHDAASLTNPALRKQFVPSGYHIPTDTEWTTLTNYLGGEGFSSTSGGRLKQTGVCHWLFPNNGAINSTGFSALGAGWRDANTSGIFVDLKNSTIMMSTTVVVENPTTTYARTLYASGGYIIRGVSRKDSGVSIRFIKD